MHVSAQDAISISQKT